MVQNYPRREKGGARPPWKTQGLASGDRHVIETSSRPASGATSRTVLASADGGPCSRLTQAEVLSLPACRTVRLLMEESSISARIACRSSDAEITGNSRTSTHPRASRHCRELSRRAARAPASRRHSQQAGSASSIHAKFSNSSISVSSPVSTASFSETPNSSQRDHSTNAES